ncbi:hypothetical protein [Sediminitomix flava]|uniref:Uncharacterized protein n=1 Tax=Sediminitomix flava TaxID=379075 RepID=A0A315ZAS4_SEDFL|nr:hypothetical protein [Sediminitomix flava]PWJ42249.1 hypothetical protein BC781_103501 [Sediminitomix flava]
MRIFILAFLFLTACSDKDIFSSVENENNELRNQIDSLKQINRGLANSNTVLNEQIDVLNHHLDSIKSSVPFIFEQGLLLEKEKDSEAEKFYNQILNEKSVNEYWKVSSEDRILDIKLRNAEGSDKWLLLNQKMKKNSIEIQNLNASILQFADTLYLIHRDEMCGEWGGNTERIMIYKVGLDKVTASYSKYSVNCDSLIANPKNYYPPNYSNEVVKELNRIEVLQLKKVIHELLIARLNNDWIISNSGVHNTVMTSDSTFIIEDYPSIDWSKFHGLKQMILK